MVADLSLILLCQLAGEIFVRAIGLPMPGPVIGLALLLLVLLARDRVSMLARGPLRHGAVEGTSKNMLAHLSLLFVPAGVGVVQQLDLLAQHGLAIFVVLVLSTIITLMATVGAFLLVARLLARRRETPEADA
ncbi:MAG: CidA/LrgA family protein [Bradyrhizobiaceae bacterium]|nr:MAG: CidA/LrgA family protein [Bradyrhizobiaceae bacterium]